jgi:hypothetical protein
MFNFSPHREKFFELFKQSAENALAGARALKEILDRYDNPNPRSSQAGHGTQVVR